MLLLIFHSIYSRPILLVGNGVRAAGAFELVREFSKKTNIPILTTMLGVDLAQGEDHIGFIGTHGNRIANMILDECDCIIAVGARLGLRQVGRYAERFAPNAHLIRADIDQYELSRSIKSDEEKYQMDAKDFMNILLKEDFPDYSEWKFRCMKAKCLMEDFDKTEGNRAVEKIASLLPKDSIVTVDVGQNQCWCAQSLVLKGEKGRILLGGGYGTMGCGLPYAIGASISNDNSVVYCIAGDGGFQMNIQELETVRREKLPIKILILNNKVLGKISETQHTNHQDRYAQTTCDSGYSVPNFRRIAEAYGINAATVSNYMDLDCYAEWLTDEKPCLLDIYLSEGSSLRPKIRWETGEIEPAISVETVETVKRTLRIR